MRSHIQFSTGDIASLNPRLMAGTPAGVLPQLQSTAGAAWISRRSRVTSWTAMVNVVPIGFEPIEERENMLKSKTAKGKKKVAAPKKSDSGKMSCLDAAAKVLGEKKEPMSTAEMIEAMATKGYWKSPGGKTPVPRPAFLAAGALDRPTCASSGRGKILGSRKPTAAESRFPGTRENVV
jgi:hypothetical protein